jgi:ABC-type methionine transport system ATPase subunit
MSYEIVDLLNHINADGTTVIMVTHDLHLVKTFNHRVITIKNGVIESDYPDASHIDVEPYKFDNPEDTVGSYFVEESGDDLDYLFQNYAVDIDAESISDSFEMAESDVYEIPQDASVESEPLTKEGDAE